MTDPELHQQGTQLITTYYAGKTPDQNFHDRLRELMLEYQMNYLEAMWELFPPPATTYTFSNDTGVGVRTELNV